MGDTAGLVEADGAREEVRALVRGRMEKREISRTPELELAASEGV